MPVNARMHLKIWLTRADGKNSGTAGQELLGQGRVELLRRMAELGSLKKAAESMGMSYRLAWGRLKKMEEALGRPLVESGDNRRGGYSLTPAVSPWRTRRNCTISPWKRTPRPRRTLTPATTLPPARPHCGIDAGGTRMESMLRWRPEAARFRHRDSLLEKSLPGADLALEACALVDLSVAEALARARQAGRAPACGAGCAACCCQPIPLTPLEALLLARYAHLRLRPEERAALARNHAAALALPPLRRNCPLLLDGRCTAYVVRPLACRRYLVLDRSCAPGEDAASSRPADLLLPDPGLLAAALLRTLPWYVRRPGCPLPPRSSDPAAARRFFRSVTTVIQALPWGKELAQEDGVA